MSHVAALTLCHSGGLLHTRRASAGAARVGLCRAKHDQREQSVDTMALAAALTSLGSVLSAGGDSQAVQLEILHEIELLLQLAPPEEVKSGQAELEKHLTAALLQGPAPPVRQLVSSAFCCVYTRGARQNMYTTVGLLLSWMDEKKKGSPASTVSSKAAILAVLGDLSRAQGANMVALCHDTITLLTKLIRANEVPLRVTACTAFASALAGSGGVGKGVHEEALKNLRHVIGERGAPVDLRVAVLSACPPLVENTEQLWTTDLVEQVATLCTKYMDDPAAPVRHAASDALGAALGAAICHPYITSIKGKGGKAAAPKPKFDAGKMFEKKKAEPTSAIEAISSLLVTPFVRQQATRELRLGISRAFVAFTRGLSQPLLERYAEHLVAQQLVMLNAPSPGRPVYDAVTHALRAGLA